MEPVTKTESQSETPADEQIILRVTREELDDITHCLTMYRTELLLKNKHNTALYTDLMKLGKKLREVAE